MKRKFTTTIDDELIDALKIESIRHKLNVNDILECLIQKFLNHEIEIDSKKDKEK